MFTKIKNFFNKKENESLTEESNREVLCRRAVNLEVTMQTISNYLVRDQLTRTGILYRPDDKYIQTKAQQLFWEWKNEGIIDEFENINETTKSWIMAYL